eukprot:TRINITY_DN3603_c0_g1_i1.p1 TRINITY_DN3603_c0_g1~~TRINITY_DN3603_c0_g1_i1.p1  ORF type:complete len:630 (-),score=147.10 TRINITY_DN3603_c0_g1_i1:127-2016(-)
MAPEILKFHNYSIKADLWSVGTILYETLTGVTPFDSKTPFELMQALEKKQVRFPDNIPVSRECLDLIYSLLQKDPTKRISWEEFFMHPWLGLERDPFSNVISAFPSQSPNYQNFQQTSPHQTIPQTTQQYTQVSPYQNYQQISPYHVPNLSQTPPVPIQSPTFQNYQQTSPYQVIPNLSQTPPHQNFPFQTNPLNIPQQQQQTYTPSSYQNPSSSPLSSPTYHFKGSPLDTPFSNTIGGRPETVPLPFSEVPPFNIPSGSPLSTNNSNPLPINVGPFYQSTPPFSTLAFPNVNPSPMLQSSLSTSLHGAVNSGGSGQMSFSHKQGAQQSISGSNNSTPTGSLSFPPTNTTTEVAMVTTQSRVSNVEYNVPVMLSDSFEIIDTPQTSHSITEPYTALPTTSTSSYTPSLPVTTPRPSFENSNNSNSNLNTSVTMEDPITTLTQNIERMGRQSLVLAELADGRVETDVPHEALPAYLRALNLLQRAILEGLKTVKGKGVGSLGIEFSDSQKFAGLVKVIGMLRERFSEYLRKVEYWKSVLPANLTTPVLEEMIYSHALYLGRIAGVDEMWQRFQKSEQLYNNGVILLEYLYQLASLPEDKRILGEYIQSFNKRLQAVRKKSLQVKTTPGKK